MFKKILATTLLSCLSATVLAQISPPIHTLIAPNCLMKELKQDYTALAQSGDFNLIQVDENGLNHLINIKTAKMSQSCGGFMNVSSEWSAQGKLKNVGAKQFLKEQLLPPKKISSDENYQIKYEAQVKQLLSQMNKQRMWDDLAILTKFDDRYYQSNNGLKAANWIKTQIENIAKESNHKDVGVYLLPTHNYKQPSVVAKFGNSDEPGIVLGGHMDTLDSAWGGLKPGADDDGSGAVTVLEVARTLLKSGMQFKKPIYFVWYAAEEIGLVGSKVVVKEFKTKGIPVSAAVQFDMTGYAHKGDLTMYLMDDYVNKDLNAFTENLIKTYVKAPVKHDRCGYACSDHASWYYGGVPSVVPFEASMRTHNPDIHTSADKMDNLSLDHMEHFAKLGIALAIELAEPVS